MLRRLILIGLAFAASLAAQSPAGAAYIAMGSSYGSGPGVGRPAPGSPAKCGQSDANYAHLFATHRHLTLADVTCSGATTLSILHTWRHLPPQLEAVGPAARLVTITIGGNDLRWIQDLFGWSCRNDPAAIGPIWQARLCGIRIVRPTPADFAALREHMAEIVAGIHRRSPSARVVFVDYYTVLPTTGSCPAKLPLTAPEMAEGALVARRLAAITRGVAEQTGSVLIQASKLTAHHGVCSPDPWVFGWHFGALPGRFGAPAYHPNAKAMRAVAAALDRALPK